MLNNKGSTLIESLFAFEIYISILVLFVGLFIQIYQQESRIQHKYSHILEKEDTLLFEEEYTQIIEMVLH